jgi:methionyl-tRNA formyltransferase
MNLCIAGKNSIAVGILREVVAHAPHGSVMVIPCRSDDGKNTWQPSLKKAAAELEIPVVDLNQVKHLNDLVFFSLEFDQIIRPNEFASARLFNIHFSELPKYRGMYTSVWPILFGDCTAGVSLHHIDAAIDRGDIIAQSTFALDPDWCCKQLYLAFLQHGTRLVQHWLPALCDLTAQVTMQPQPLERATYFSRHSLDFRNVRLDFSTTAWQVCRQVKAFVFRDYQLPMVNGCAIVHAEPAGTFSTARPGTITAETETYLSVATVDYDVHLYLDRQVEFFQACLMGDLGYIHSHWRNLAYVDDQDGSGQTALMIAAAAGHADVCQCLLDRGADPSLQDYQGISVLDHANGEASVLLRTQLISRDVS